MSRPSDGGAATRDRRDGASQRKPDSPRRSVEPRPSSADLLLHPVAVIALAVLLFNDHLFKEIGPTWLSGKLSDLAGLVVAPLIGSVLLAAATRRLGQQVQSRWPLVLAVLATGCGFAAVKLLPPAADTYRLGLGYLQWPFSAAASVPNLPPIRPVQMVADASDLLALPMLLVPLWIARGARPHHSSRSHERVASIVLVLCGVALVATSPAVPSVSDSQTFEAVPLTAEAPMVSWEITFTATSDALLGGRADAGVSVVQRTGPNTRSTRDDIQLTLIGLHPDSAVSAALDAYQDDVVAELYWNPFAGCAPTVSCAETYRLEVRWTDPGEAPLSVDVGINVSIPTDVEGSISGEAKVDIGWRRILPAP